MTQKKTKTEKNIFFEWVKTPKSRKVIYGVTDRRKDPWYLQINDFMLDHQGLSVKEKARFFHSLKLLVASGVQFINAIEMMARRTKHVRFSRILQTVAYDMERSGMSFSQALQKYPNVFSQSEVKMIYSGELTGKIETTLNSIATQLQKNIELDMKIKSALMYPITVLIAIFLAAMVVMIFIVPKLTSMFLEFGSELPISTRILIGASDFLIHFWWLVLTAVIGGIFAFKNWKNSDRGKLKYDQLLLTLPIIGTINNYIQTVRISSNFATLMDSGVAMNKALKVLSEIVPNRVVGDAIFNIEVDLRNGMKLHKAFEKQKCIDPVLPEIIEVGERTGHISDVLRKLANQYDLEVEAQLKNLSTLIEPIIIVFVGVAVIFMMLAVLTPIFQIQELFSQAG